MDKEKINTRFFIDASRPSGWAPYTGGGSVQSTIRNVANKYTGKDPAGSYLVQNVVDSRSSFLIGGGISLRAIEGVDGTQEIELARKVIKWNNLDKGFLYNLAVEAEIEGRLLLYIDSSIPSGSNSEAEDGEPVYTIRHLPYSKYKYRINMDESNDSVIKSVSYTNVSGETTTIDADDFVFAMFGATRYYDPNEGVSRVAGALEDIETVSAAKRDLREVNHLFAHPTPVFKTETANEAKSLNSQLMEQKWSIGTMVVSTAEYSVVGVDTGGTEVLLNEINSAIQRISGATGVPIYFLGLSSDMVNRATAYAMMEALDINVAIDRKRFETLFENLFNTIFSKHNESLGTKLNAENIQITIPSPSVILEQRTEQTDRLLNLYLAGALSLRTLLSKINEVTDVDREILEIGDREQVQVERKTSMLSAEENSGAVKNIGKKKGDKDTLK